MALRSGIKSDRFAVLSVKEIRDEIEAFNDTAEADMKKEIVLLHKQAYWIAIGFNEPKKFPQLKQEFPALFMNDEEPSKYKKIKKKKVEQWEIDKMNMALYASAFNSNRKGAGQ